MARKRNTHQYQILRYEEIPVEAVMPNEANPRGDIQLLADDPKLRDMAASIATSGQHNPGLVYEQVGHWSLPDQPGHYVILQGERRWRACRLAGAKVSHYRALVVETPKSKEIEMEWLGIDESHKEQWQTFYLLRFARDLAAEKGIAVTSAEIASKTGLGADDLRTAERLFRLEPELLALVEEYENEVYRQRIAGRRTGRIAMSSLSERARDFSINKAVMVQEIFTLLREHYDSVVEDRSDLDVQMALVAKATTGGASLQNLDDFRRSLKANIGKPQMLAEVDKIINGGVRIKDSLKASGNANVSEFAKFVASVAKLANRAQRMAHKTPHLNLDENDQLQASNELVSLAALLMQMSNDIKHRR